MKKSSYILLILTAIALTVVYFTAIKPSKRNDEEPEKTNPAFSFKRKDIVSISITRDGHTLELQSLGGDRWTVVKPLNVPADEFAADALANAIVEARVENQIATTNHKLKEYGLNNPKVRIAVKLKSKAIHYIDLGVKDPTNTSVYAKIDDGAHVLLLPFGILEISDKPLNDYRERNLMRVVPYDLVSIKTSNAKGGYELIKKNGHWQINSPVESAIDEAQVTSFLAELTSAKAVDFISDSNKNLSKYGIDQSKIYVTAKLISGGERSIRIGSILKDGNYYAKVSDYPEVVIVEPSLYDKFNLTSADLRSKRFMNMSRNDITGIQIRNANVKLSANKNNDKWIIKEPVDRKDKQANISKLLDLLDNKAIEVIDTPSGAIIAKSLSPVAEIIVMDKNGKSTSFKVTKPVGEFAYLKVEGNPLVYKVPKAIAEALNFKIEDIIAG